MDFYKLQILKKKKNLSFRNGNQIHYEGERKKEKLLQFAERSAGPFIGSINNISKLNKAKKI